MFGRSLEIAELFRATPTRQHPGSKAIGSQRNGTADAARGAGDQPGLAAEIRVQRRLVFQGPAIAEPAEVPGEAGVEKKTGERSDHGTETERRQCSMKATAEALCQESFGLLGDDGQSDTLELPQRPLARAYFDERQNL